MTQAKVGWRSFVTSVVNAVDADAQAFISAAGITDLTQAAAINTLVNDLKTYGIWSKMKALYPFVGGSATSHKFNLKDPRDLDAAFRIVFNGNWTHASTGIKPASAYADTKFNPSISSTLNNTHLSIYSRTNISSTLKELDINATDGDFLPTLSLTSGYQGVAYADQYNYVSGSGGRASFTNTNTTGFYIGSRTSNTSLTILRNGVVKGISTTSHSGTMPNRSVYIGRNTAGTIIYSSKEFAFASIGDGLTDTEASNFYTSVQKFQTTLGRQVGTPYVSDPDAVAFLTAAGITDSTQAAAINALVIRMKADGLWTKMKAIYPFVGGSATSHKWNLKDPRDLDVAYRLSFSGGMTHDSNGVTMGGANGNAMTYFNPRTQQSIGNLHLSMYARVRYGNRPANANDFIPNTSYSPIGWVALRATSNNFGGSANNIFFVTSEGTNGGVGGIDTSVGFAIGSRTSTSSIKIFKNNTLIGSISGTNTDNYANANLTINGNTLNEYSQGQYAFSSIGDGLTDTEAANFYIAVQEFQTTLGRQVGVPLVSDTDAQAFLNAANITSFQQASAVNTLVTDLKAAGVWSKMKAIYPFVGGSATSHKWNLKDPRDLDAAYRLVFNGGWTHSSTGVLPNGTTAYANTFLSPNSRLNLTSNHFSYYSRSNIAAAQQIEMGVADNLAETPLIAFSIRFTGDIYRYFNPDYNVTNISTSNTDSRGFYVGSRTANNSHKTFKDGNQQGVNTTTITQSTLPSSNLYIGVYNFAPGAPAAYSSKESAFASIGDGLTDAEAANLYTAVQKFQTSLGRQVGTPVYNTNGLVLNLDAGNANSYPGTGTTWFDLATGNNGTMFSGITYDVNNGGGLIFNGSNQYISSFNNTNLNFTSSDKFTISCFFKATSTSSYLGLVVSGNTSGEWNYGLWVTNGKLQVGTHNNNRVGNSTIVAGQIYHATLTYSNNTMKVYLNGLNDGTFPSISLFNGLNQQLTIGRKGARAENYFPGTVYNVQIYNRELSETEVLNNFNSTRGRFGL